MITLEDCFGNEVSLSSERLAHILEHPEMLGMEAEIKTTLLTPELVRKSRTDPNVSLFYKFYRRTALGGKLMAVVVKYPSGQKGFVVTAYLTEQPKPGDDIWPKK